MKCNPFHGDQTGLPERAADAGFGDSKALLATNVGSNFDQLCCMKAVAYLANALLRPIDARVGALNPFTSCKSRSAGNVRRCASTLIKTSSRSQATERLNMRSPLAWPNHRVVQVDSRNTEVYHMNSTGGFEHTSNQVLILPGNPGSAGYYEAYIAALHAALHGQADIHAVSHLGHASSRKARQHGNKVFSLQEQINHKVAYIHQHMSQRHPIAIIGHSIGAYMALKVTTRLQAVPSASPEIAKVLAIFPFLQADLSTGQQKIMHALTKAPRLMGVIGALLGLLPSRIKRWLVNWWGGGLDDYAEKATIGLLNYSTIRNGFFLGQTEFRDLAGPVDWKELQELGDKVAVICNPHDTWFSQRSWEEMWLAVPNVKAYMEESQRHDFCVSAKLSASLAYKSAEIWQDILPQTNPTPSS